MNRFILIVAFMTLLPGCSTWQVRMQDLQDYEMRTAQIHNVLRDYNIR
jgi:hypothetical protein